MGKLGSNVRGQRLPTMPVPSVRLACSAPRGPLAASHRVSLLGGVALAILLHILECLPRRALDLRVGIVGKPFECADASLIGKPQVRGMMPKGFRRLRPSATVGGPRRLDQRLCDARILTPTS